MKKIVLATINARYYHSSIGLRYLHANLNELIDETVIKEFLLEDSAHQIAEKILFENPKIIGFGVYIWNATETARVLDIIKKVAPETIVVLGGPEVSYLPFRVNLDSSDYIIQGEGEIQFYQLSKMILNGTPPNGKIIKASLPNIEDIKFPYSFYNEKDINHRIIYVEASRGCPFTCEFCLSSLDKTVRYFGVNKFLEEMQILWDKGVRQFKFIDRTFNLNIKITNQILDFFLVKEPPYFLHFEVIPDHFPESLREKIKGFPSGSLQLEIGIQTLDDETSDNISRKLNFDKIADNVKFLELETKAHLHLDLIIGLPGEPIESFGKNLNTLVGMTKSEIQLGMLKKLSGTQLTRHDKKYGMVYSDTPPYEILQNDLIPFSKMQKMRRFARFWDLYYNSGNFKKSITFLWMENSVYDSFYDFAENTYNETLSTWKISLDRPAQLLFDYLTEKQKMDKTFVADTIAHDITKISGRPMPIFLREYVTQNLVIDKKDLNKKQKRQIKHL